MRTAICAKRLNAAQMGNTFRQEGIWMEQQAVQQIGNATYVIERVFTQNKPPREAVIEEIITTAKQAMKFDHSDGEMV